MPLISVIVPVYQVEPYLHRCVDSILNQTFTDFELILVDDGSPDRCGEICDGYAARDLRVSVIHQRNGGLSAARNAGIDRAMAFSDSSWIAFVDSDDWIHPQYLKLLLNAALNYHTQAAVCDCARVGDDAFTKENEEFQIMKITPETLWKENVMAANSACCKLYKKELFRDVRFPVGKTQEDLFVIYRVLFQFQKIAYISPAMYYYYFNQNGISGSQWTYSRLAAVEALKSQRLYFRKHHFTEAEIIAAKGLAFEIIYALKVLTVCHPEDTRLIREQRRTLRKLGRTYKSKLDLTEGNGKKTFERFAYPVRTLMKKKMKHLLLWLYRKKQFRIISGLQLFLGNA